MSAVARNGRLLEGRTTLVTWIDYHAANGCAQAAASGPFCHLHWGRKPAADHPLPAGLPQEGLVLKMVRKLGRRIGPPGPALPDAPAVASAELAMANAATIFSASPRCFARKDWLIVDLRPGL